MSDESDEEIWKKWASDKKDSQDFFNELKGETSAENLEETAENDSDEGTEQASQTDEFTEGYVPDDFIDPDGALSEEGENEAEENPDNIVQPGDEDEMLAKKSIEQEAEEQSDRETRNILNYVAEEGETDYSGDSAEDAESADLNAESLKYSQAGNDSISFEDLDESVSSESDDDKGIPSYSPEDGSEQKTDFESLMGMKKGRSEFRPGRLNKNYIMLAIGFLALVTLVFFGLQKKLQERREALKAPAENSMNKSEYEPDYGNFEERRHKETPEEKTRKDAAYINDMLSGGKKTYTSGEKSGGQNVPGYQPAPVSYSSPESNSDLKAAIDSPLKYSAEGFGSKNSGQGGSFSMFPGTQMAANGVQGLPDVMSKDQFAQSYLSSLNLGNDGKNGYDGVNNGRHSEAGRYDKNASGGDIYSIPENSIYPGTIIPAVLVNGINTDYPGTITARVVSPVYDSKYGQTLLIPQGSILRASYSSASVGIAKVQIAWETLIINRDGMDYVVNLGSMVGVDKNGYSGIKGTLNDHYFQYVRAAGLSAMFTLINHNIYTYSNASKTKVTQDMISDAQSVGQRLTEKILERALDIEPTVIVNPRERINVDVDKILTLIPIERDAVKERYVRR